MSKTREWPVRAMYLLIAAALALSLIIVAAPAQKVSASPGLSEWTRVDTPTTDGWVLAPASVIIDYALAEGGEVAYAVVWSAFNTTSCDTMKGGESYLLKSDDHAATWDDITDALEDELDDNDYIEGLLHVATDWVDPDFVAVALWWYDDSAGSTYLSVFFSTDGGTTFEDIGEVEDGGTKLVWVSDLAVSYENGDDREIAIGGTNGTAAALFRSTVTGDSAGNWEDATEYNGWDDDGTFPYGPSILVTDIIFSTSWATDKTILVTTVAPDDNYETVYLQCGSWGATEGWNEMSTLGIEAVPIVKDVPLPMFLTMWDARSIAGITLPEDYNSKDTDTRILWVWVNYIEDPMGTPTPMCAIMRVDDDSADPVGPMGQIEDGELWLTNISYKGTIAEGEAMAGVLGNGGETDDGLFTECCEGVQVYRNDGIRDMDICCERWHDACKPPTGKTAMAVSYVGEDKAYAVPLQGDGYYDGGWYFYDVTWYDESAWSVTFDDGDTWNQLSLIDTNIDYFSDVAVSPDCNKTMLVSANIYKYCIDYGEPRNGEPTGCDSVWLHADTLPEAEEYSGQWLRTWSGRLEGQVWVPQPRSEAGMLRLAPEETTGDTVVLFDYYTGNVYRNDLETLACWDPIGSTVLNNIVDLALQDADTFFALDANGDVAMFDDDEWQEEVDSEVDEGNTIAVWGDHILVGGAEGEVSYSDDGGETFTLLEDLTTIDGWVTVAFDTYFDTNMVVYAATFVESDATGGIYSWVIGESEEWTDLKAEPTEDQIFGNDNDDTFEVGFTGLVVDRPGNPYTSPDNGGVIYASYLGNNGSTWFTGVARSLERDIDICTTCLTWDFLHVGLTIDEEGFNGYPDALKICGCLTPDSNTHLFAIDSWFYDMCENEDGSVWTYEDCYAKKAPEITSPADGAVIPADPCSCYSVPFTVLWDAICDACSFDIAFAMDEDFTMPVKVNEGTGLIYHIVSDDPSFSVMGGPDGGLSCETTYYVRIRAADAATGEIIHSWWSDPIAITIAPSVEAGIITLVAPEPGALNQPTMNVGFSWDLLATTDAFDWVLDDNADLSSPVDSKNLTTTACTYTGTLSYGTTYYWQVTAYNEGALLSVSAIGTFTTAAQGEFCCPQCGLCFDTQAELQAHIADEHPAQPATPFWVWIVIAIGAVLVIVVIVLIFRTRRV